MSSDYQRWKKQDALLKSWLLSSMTKPFTTRMVGCELSHHIWKRLYVSFASQITAKIHQLKSRLGNTKKEGAVNEYLLDVKKIIDALISVGAAVNDADHVAVILNGLPEEYSPFITTIISRSVPVSVGELEALLMAQEELIEKYKRTESLVHANIAQFSAKGGGRSGYSRGSFRGRGRGGRFGNRGGKSSNWPSCQVCGKVGHTALDCWFRFDASYTSQGSNQNQQYNNQNQNFNNHNFDKARANLTIATPSIL